MLSEDRMIEMKEKIENRTFNEHDIRMFIHLLAEENHESSFYSLEKKFMYRRQKGLYLKMNELCSRFENRNVEYLFHDPSVDTADLYSILHNELINAGTKYNIKMDEQTIKEIIICIYSLMQFTTFYKNRTREHYNSLLVGRFCLIEKDRTLSLAIISYNHIHILSTISDVIIHKEYKQALITDFAYCERIDGKLVMTHFRTEEVIAEI